jgi:hypothetical protein
MRNTFTQISTTHFIDDETGEEFKVGKEIWLRPDYAIGYGRASHERTFTIKSFWVSEVNGVKESDNGKHFGFVYANFEGTDIGHSSYLNSLMLPDEDLNCKFREYTNNHNIQYPLNDKWRALREKKLKTNNHDRKYYILI